MRKVQAVAIVIFFLLIILVPSLLLSFFSINAIKNEENLYQRRLESRYHSLLTKIRDQSSIQLRNREKELLAKISKDFQKKSRREIFTRFKELVKEDSLFDFPFIFSPQGERIFPYPTSLILPTPSREEAIRSILEPARRLEEENRLEAALSEYRHLTSLYRNQADVHLPALFSLADCHAKTGNFAKALSVYQDILRLYPLENQGNIIYLSFLTQLKIGQIYRQTGNLQRYYQIYIRMLRFLIEHKEAFPPERERGLRKKLMKALEDPKLLWVQKAMEKMDRWEKRHQQKRQFFHLLEKKMQGYLSERVRKVSPPELAKSEIRLPLPSQPEVYGRLGHLESSIPEKDEAVLYFVLSHPRGNLLLGVQISRPNFLDQFVEKMIAELGEDKEVQVIIKEGEEKDQAILADLSLFYPFDETYLMATLKNKQLFDHLSNVRVKNYIFAVSIAIVTIAVGTLGIILYVFQQIKTAQMKSDFVSNVTHELKTPLTSIRMFVETIIMGRVQSREEELECLKIISKETERLSRLIEKILEFSSLENKIKSFRFTSCLPEEVIEESIEVFRQQIAHEECHIRFNIIQNIQAIRIDKDSIKEVLINLFNNAYKYSEKKPKITVNLKESKGYVVIEVIDNGIGIPQRHIKKIFQKFYRVNNLLTSSKEGTGLGLAICRSIIKAHRGKIQAESQVGEGSKFTVLLPK